jgi:hypothetical protein
MLIVSSRARLVKWVTENNRPTNIVNDRELEQLLTAGRPHIKIPSTATLSRDVKACFKKCRERVGKLLKEHPGHVHIASDAWTSPNHRAFIAWTVHLEHEGQMLAFLLDMVEIPEVSYFLMLLLSTYLSLIQSHSGVTMALAFQRMLERFGLQDRVLAFNGDNASSNDTQAKKLASLKTSFEIDNRIRCFNHTTQLSAKALIRPFNAGMASAGTALDEDEAEAILDDLDVDDAASENEDDNDKDSDGADDGEDDVDDGIDELEALSDEEREEIIADTAVVRFAVTKVHTN